MKEKLFLIAFGLTIGALGVWAARPMITSLVPQLPEGAEFETVEDFQRAMLKRDERDQKPDQSVSLRSIITPHPSDSIMYDLIPDLEVKFQGVPVRTNRCGMRGPELTHAKPDNTYRLAFLGDSFTFGWGVHEEEAFPWVVEKLLNEVFQGSPRIEVMNFGVPGYSTFQQVALFEEKALDFQPDGVLVFFVDNDFGLPFFIKNIHKKGSVVSGTKFARASWSGKDKAIEEQNKKLLQKLNPNQHLRHLSRLGRQHDMDVFVAINPRPNWQKDLNRLPVLRKKMAPNLVRMRKEFISLVEANNIDPKDLSLPHDPHPSALKHKLLGYVMSASILPAIDQKAPAFGRSGSTG